MTVSKTGRILAIGKTSLQKFKNKKKVYGCILPGLIDPHTHLVFAGQRAGEWAKRLAGVTYQDIARKGGGIQTTVRATRVASEVELFRIAKKRVERFLAQGVTTLEAKTGYGLDQESELKTLRVMKSLNQRTPLQIVSTFLGAHAPAPEFKTTSAFVDHLISDVLPKVKGLAEFQDVFVEEGYFGKKEAIRLLLAGKAFGLKPKVHAHEFGRTGGVEVAVKVGAISADHLQYMSEGDISQMKKAGVIPVILPCTSFFLGGAKYAPARKMWDAGLPVAIASDFNPGTNPSWNLPLCGSMAAMKEGLNLDEVLIAQTKHAAWAIGRKDRGVLSTGMKADFIALDAKNFEEMYYHYGTQLVEAVFIDAKKIL